MDERQYQAMIKSRDSKQDCLSALLAAVTVGSYLTCPCPGLFTCKINMIIVCALVTGL